MFASSVGLIHVFQTNHSQMRRALVSTPLPSSPLSICLPTHWRLWGNRSPQESTRGAPQIPSASLLPNNLMWENRSTGT